MSNPVWNDPLMKPSTILSGLMLLAALALVLVNEMRTTQKIADALRAQPAPTPVVSGPDEAELRDALNNLKRARQELAIAEENMVSLAGRIHALEGQLQTVSQALASVRPPGVAPAVDPPAQAEVRRSWGPEQATGPADTQLAGDVPTAWAPREQDGGEEWLKLEYDKMTDLAEIVVRETYNPGAVRKVTAFLPDGREVIIWEGVEPEATAPVDRRFVVPYSMQAASVKVYLDTRRVPGWNEIDAVAVIGRDGSQQWARKASASSTFAEQGGLGGRLSDFGGLESVR